MRGKWFKIKKKCSVSDIARITSETEILLIQAGHLWMKATIHTLVKGVVTAQSHMKEQFDSCVRISLISLMD